MSTMEKKRKAQQVRQDYLKQRAQRHSGRADLGVPEVVDAILGDPDGLLPVSALANDIKIKIPDWSVGGPEGWTERLVFQWETKQETTPTTLLEENFTLPILEPFPLERTIEKKCFEGREGVFEFQYGVKLWNDSTIVFSKPIPITFDRTPPYGTNNPPAVDDPGLITDDLLKVNDGVEVTIPDFVEDKKEFVRILLGWSDKVPPANTPIVADVNMLLPADRKILVPKSVVEKFPSGNHYIAYMLLDKAGNPSRLSSVRTVPVALGPLPENLQPPFVPLAPGNGDDLIDLADAHLGVVVQVPEFVNHQPTDQVVVTWGNSELVGVRVGESPLFPIEVSVIWEHLKDQYTDDPNDQTTPVTYSIVRGSTPFPLKDADSITVEVNFAYTGPPNPDDPDPVNRDLAPVIVRGVSDKENQLIESDNGKNATATVTVYDPPTVGDVITLYWNDVAVAQTYTLDGKEKPGDEITLTVAWDEIVAGGRGTVPVYYTLSHPDLVNEQRSVDTSVLVEAIVITLDATEYPDANGGVPILNCKSLRKSSDGDIGYLVHVPASVYLVEGKRIEMYWVITDHGTKVMSSEKTQTISIPPGADVTGIDWFVEPYATHILPAYDGTIEHWGYAESFYTLTIGSESVASTPVPVIVGIADLSSEINTCDLSDIAPYP